MFKKIFIVTTAFVSWLYFNSLALAVIEPSHVSDHQITKIMTSLNEGEIDAAMIAKSRSQNSDIIAFADMMLTGHSQNKADLNSLSAMNGFRPDDSNINRDIYRSAKVSNEVLRNTSSETFDRMYAQQQVDMHQKALDTINTYLIPSSLNSNLRTFLEKTRDTVSTHLDQAKTLNAKFL